MPSKSPRAALSFCLTCVLIFHARSTVVAQTYAYTVTNLGVSSDGVSSISRSINSRGDVVGTIPSFQAGSTFLYNRSRVSILPSTDPPAPSIPISVNDLDHVLTIGSSPKQNQTFGFLYDGAKFINLNTEYGFDSFSPSQMNDKDDIIGFAQTKLMGRQILIHQGQPIDIGSLLAKIHPSSYSVSCISDSGFIGGQVSGTFPYIYDGKRKLSYTTPGYDTGYSFEPEGINDNGKMVGFFYEGLLLNKNTQIQLTDGFIFSPGNFRYLKFRDDRFGEQYGLTAINDLDDMVGWNSNGPIVIQNNVPLALNNLIDTKLGLTIYGALGLNNSGQIACTAAYSNGSGSTSWFAARLDPNPNADIISTVDPVEVGRKNVKFDVKGVGFVPGSAAYAGTTKLDTVFVNPNLVRAILPITPPTVDQGVNITVKNPNDQVSNIVRQPLLCRITKVSPYSITGFSQDVTVTLSGEGFASGLTVINDKGLKFSPTLLSSKKLQFTIPALTLKTYGGFDFALSFDQVHFVSNTEPIYFFP